MDEALCPESEEIDTAGYAVLKFSPNSACSVRGLCISLDASVAEVAAAKVAPVLALFGPSAVTILEGDPWELCPPRVGFQLQARFVSTRVEMPGGILTSFF